MKNREQKPCFFQAITSKQMNDGKQIQQTLFLGADPATTLRQCSRCILTLWGQWHCGQILLERSCSCSLSAPGSASRSLSANFCWMVCNKTCAVMGVGPSTIDEPLGVEWWGAANCDAKIVEGCWRHVKWKAQHTGRCYWWGKPQVPANTPASADF